MVLGNASQILHSCNEGTWLELQITCWPGMQWKGLEGPTLEFELLCHQWKEDSNGKRGLLGLKSKPQFMHL